MWWTGPAVTWIGAPLLSTLRLVTGWETVTVLVTVGAAVTTSPWPPFPALLMSTTTGQASNPTVARPDRVQIQRPRAAGRSVTGGPVHRVTVSVRRADPGWVGSPRPAG